MDYEKWGKERKSREELRQDNDPMLGCSGIYLHLGGK